MSRVLLLVEGQTERAIAEAVLAPHLAEKGVWLYPRIVGKPGHKGGNSFSTVLRELKSLRLAGALALEGKTVRRVHLGGGDCQLPRTFYRRSGRGVHGCVV